MKRTDYKSQYKRNLPHYQPIGATLFVTMRLANSLPIHVIEKIQSEHQTEAAELTSSPTANSQKELHALRKRRFARFDGMLDRAEFGPTWLTRPRLASVVSESLCFRNGRVYTLFAFTIMSNHVHIVFRPQEKENGVPYSLSGIMMSIKRRTARECNTILGRQGQFWQHESYDHVVRDQREFERIIRYVLDNPVKAGLAERWEDWPWNYLNEES